MVFLHDCLNGIDLSAFQVVEQDYLSLFVLL